MPFYTVGHSCDLTAKQQDTLAQAITRIHAEKFNTPYLFVNVVFEDLSNKPCYVGGRRVPANMIMADFRTNGPKGSRSQTEYDDVCREVARSWEEIVGTEGDSKLRVVGIKAGLASIIEAGIVVPVIGEEGKWAKENMERFKKMAENGDEDMISMLEDIKRRKLYGMQ